MVRVNAIPQLPERGGRDFRSKLANPSSASSTSLNRWGTIGIRDASKNLAPHRRLREPGLPERLPDRRLEKFARVHREGAPCQALFLARSCLLLNEQAE